MNTKLFLVGLVALIVGAGGGYMFAPSTPQQNSHAMPGEMSNMLAGLAGKTGDEFDKAFLSEMIVHHEGAVAMAESALVHAQHAEIKEMAKAILSAQTTEIAQMRNWQKSWYGQE